MLSKIQVFVLFLGSFNLQKTLLHYNTSCIGLLFRTEVNCPSKMENPISPRALLYQKAEYLHFKKIYTELNQAGKKWIKNIKAQQHPILGFYCSSMVLAGNAYIVHYFVAIKKFLMKEKVFPFHCPWNVPHHLNKPFHNGRKCTGFFVFFYCWGNPDVGITLGIAGGLELC